MKENKTTKTNSAFDYLGYALYAFGGLGIEILLMLLETNLYGNAHETWTGTQNIIHWTITCLIWGALGLALAKQLPAKPEGNVAKTNWALAVVIIAMSIIYTSLVWRGFKPVMEFFNLGAGEFFVQYVYYAFESLLILMIIAHGQSAFERWFGKARFVPFGGALLAITWGLIHIFTQGGSTGIYTVVQSLLYGSVYLALNKEYKTAYVAIALMFML